ncbi:hypothetical protein Tcan_06646 [Toxocara canis]|uniref:Uncharacterized protein n=1 Tax=Toxocara canis TaxID=6265 RepID=A0A0B2VYM0_TOXCA|nr:hypothetical protein Tcan_06646 [Toxocara canis]
MQISSQFQVSPSRVSGSASTVMRIGIPSELQLPDYIQSGNDAAAMCSSGASLAQAKEQVGFMSRGWCKCAPLIRASCDALMSGAHLSGASYDAHYMSRC